MPEKHEGAQEEPLKNVHLKDLVNIRQTMNDLFSDLFSGKPIRSLLSQEQWFPPVDIYENKEFIYILMDIPGMTAKDIDITATQDSIVIKGERKPVKEVGTENYILKEHSYGEFSRSIPLPYPIKPREIKATYKDGTLELKLPKTKSGKGKTIRIDVE
jgi:HSP20 family protein